MVPSRHAAARLVLSPAFGHVCLLSGKNSLCHTPQRHFSKDLLKVRLRFKRTPANTLVFNKTSVLPSGSAARSGWPWLYFGRGAGVDPTTSHRSLHRRKRIFCTHKTLTQQGKAAPLARCKSGTTPSTRMGSLQIYRCVSKCWIWPPVPWDEHQPSPLPPESTPAPTQRRPGSTKPGRRVPSSSRVSGTVSTHT